MLATTDILAWVQSTLVVATRVAPIMALSPLLNSFRIPASARLIAVIALSLAISQDPSRQFIAMQTIGGLFETFIAEAVTGAVLALGVHSTFAAFSVAGQAIDIQSGLAIASVIDPVTKTSSGTISQIFSVSALALFFYTDTHLNLLRAIDLSFDWFPVGTLMDADALLTLATRGSLIFSYAVAITAPVLAGLLMIDIAISITSRSMPQINILVLATPIKSVAAIGLLSISCKFWVSETTTPFRIFESFFPQ